MDSTRSSRIFGKKEEHKSKRYKSNDDSSFNTKELGEGSFNLNSTTRDKEDEVQEVQRQKGLGHDRVIADDKDGAGTQACRAGNLTNGSTSKRRSVMSVHYR
ncbi:hypothetical protein Tco_0873267 [Tanacetum coccineum]